MATNNRYYLDVIDSEITLLNSDISLVIEIYKNAEALTEAKTKEARSKIKEFDASGYGNLSESEKLIYDDATEAITNLVLHFNQITLHSLFVTSFSFFEHYFFRIARALQNYTNKEIKISDISTNKGELDQWRRYLNLVQGLKAAKGDTKNWQKILVFQKIRNIIVHQRNMFGTRDEKHKEIIIKFLKGYQVHMVRDFGFRITDRDFLEDFRKVVIEYTLSLYNEIASPKLVSGTDA